MASEKHVATMAFDNNPNIGLYAFATDEYCLIGHDIPEKFIPEMEEVLDVPVHRVNIAGTSLIGVFCTGNKNKLLVPHIIQPDEIKELEKLKINFEIIESKITALGNNITTNDTGAVVSTEFPDAVVEVIAKALAVPTKKGKVSELDNVGSCLVVNNEGGLVHRGIKSFELKFLENLFHCEILDGTVNMGNPYVKSGIISNSHGFIIGAHSGGPEITNADMALGFLEE
jgi:translation initiation factor 6